mmetsp:Transcript_43649/g.85636  ORF Transcript_43649/g.85636 Transcript_43649/m.85636 type:complete len:145 (+) Transcript_43649:79-513(+)
MVYEGNSLAGSAKDKINVGTERTKNIYKNHVQGSKFRQNRYVYPTNLTIKEGRDQSFAIETEYRPKEYIKKPKCKENSNDESFILTHPAALTVEEGKERVFTIEAEYSPKKDKKGNGKSMMQKIKHVLHVSSCEVSEANMMNFK